MEAKYMKNDSPRKKSGTLSDSILDLSDDIFRAVKLSIPPDWLSSDMTLAQLRLLLFLHTEGPCRMSAIATSLGTTMPTITGTVDLLVKKGLAVRRDDPSDRRLVIIELSTSGVSMMDEIWALGRAQMKKLLHGLSTGELKKAQEVAEILFRNVTSDKNTQ
jgi:DNA-binding MarR family transcriptional regulator